MGRGNVRWLGALFAGIGVVLLAACTDAPPAAPHRTPEESPDDEQTPPSCLVDRDGDGFGLGCQLGPDCDDQDPARATECDVTAGERCEPGQVEPCYVVEGAVADTLSCGVGERTCVEGGLWGHCEVSERVEREVPPEALSTGPEPCNPCNPGCGRATDIPTDEDIILGENADRVAFDEGRGGIVLSDEEDGIGPGGPDGDGDGTPDDYDLDPADPLVDGYVENGDRFFVLPFGGPVVAGEVDIRIELRSADIYFLMDTTGSMQGEIDNLRTSLTSGNFLLDPTVCGLEEDFQPVRLADWEAAYFDNRTLSGSPALTRVDPEIDFVWGRGSPDPRIPDDSFSVRWSKEVDLPQETTFRFQMRTDDGMRVVVDGVVEWASWRNQGPTNYDAEVVVAPGRHTIAIEYYEAGGGAVAEASAVGQVGAPEGYEGLIGALRCQIADPAFAIGYFDDYPVDRYGYSLGDGACNDAATGTEHDLPFHQLIGSTPPEDPADLAAIQTAVDRLVARCGDDRPESHLAALYAIATGAGLPYGRDGFYATPPPAGGMDGSDPLMPAVPPTPTGNPVGPGFPVDYEVGDVATAGVAIQASTAGLGGQHSGGCNASADAPDAAFRFEVSQRRTIVASVQNATFDPVVSIYRANGGREGCDDSDGTGVDQDETLDPGTYYAVVDGSGPGQEGDFRLYLGPVVGDTVGNALEVGDLASRWVEIAGDTRNGVFSNFTRHVDCWGGDKGGARDVVLRFELSEPSNVVFTNAGSDLNSVFQLYDADFDFRYCHNGAGDQASMFQRLDAGTHYVVYSGSGGSNGAFRLGMGAWPDDSAYLTPEGPACPEGAFGYPCFREGTIPIVVMFTDAEMHNGDGGDDRYSDLAAPAYMDAMLAMNRIGAKMVGIHSGEPADQRCSTPCLEREQEYECWEETYCAERVEYEDCWEQNYCAEWGPYYEECELKTRCQQGGLCWEEEVCEEQPDCLRRDTRTRCRTRSRCDRYDTRTECGYRDGDCITYGETACTYDPEASEDDMRTLSQDTGSVNGEGEPFVYQINENGTGLSEAVVRAIAELSGSVRLDVTLRVNDNPATAAVDERRFVKSVRTVSDGDPPPETLTRCLATYDTWYQKCLPGTTADFRLGVQNDFVAPAEEDQLFTFTVDLMGDGIYVLQTFQIVVLVPKTEVSYPEEGRFWRDYDAYDHCQPGQLPEWGNFSWVADVPDGTELVFEFRAALDPADLDLVDAPATVLVPPDVPPVLVRDRLQVADLITNAPNMRVTAVLRSSAGRDATPVLESFELEWNCTSVD